jgi:hypothetical protein
MKKLTELKQYEELCEYLKGLYTQELITKEIITEFRNHI